VAASGGSTGTPRTSETGKQGGLFGYDCAGGCGAAIRAGTVAAGEHCGYGLFEEVGKLRWFVCDLCVYVEMLVDDRRRFSRAKTKSVFIHNSRGPTSLRVN
jgi:hypothetical protein